MNIKLSIKGKQQIVSMLRIPFESVTTQSADVRVLDRGEATLGWNGLYATLVAQARRNKMGENEVVAWTNGRMIELGLIEGVHPDAITFDDLKYLLANLSSLAHNMLTNVTLDDDLDIDPILEQLARKGWELGDPNTPIDEPDPSYAQAFFVEATQAMRAGNYQGWWSPIERESLSIGAPGGPGQVKRIGQEEESQDAVEGSWGYLGIGAADKIIKLLYIGQDRLLDWEPATGHFRVWQYSRLDSWYEELSGPILEGDWSTIGVSHELIWLGRDPGSDPASADDLVLDWIPAGNSAGYYRLYRVDLTGTHEDGTPDVLPEPPLAASRWPSIQNGKQLIYLGNNRVLEWKPSSGENRIWNLKRDATEKVDPLDTLISSWKWLTIGDGHRLVNIGGNRILDWHVPTKSARIWDYDPDVNEKDNRRDPFPEPPVANFSFDDLDEGYQLVWLGGNHLLAWDPKTGDYRIWRYDRALVSANPLK